MPQCWRSSSNRCGGRWAMPAARTRARTTAGKAKGMQGRGRDRGMIRGMGLTSPGTRPRCPPPCPSSRGGHPPLAALAPPEDEDHTCTRWVPHPPPRPPPRPPCAPRLGNTRITWPERRRGAGPQWRGRLGTSGGETGSGRPGAGAGRWRGPWGQKWEVAVVVVVPQARWRRALPARPPSPRQALLELAPWARWREPRPSWGTSQGTIQGTVSGEGDGLPGAALVECVGTRPVRAARARASSWGRGVGSGRGRPRTRRQGGISSGGSSCGEAGRGHPVV